MKTDLGSFLPIMLGLITLGGYIWQAAELKANIKAQIAQLESKTIVSIDALKDELVKEIIVDKHKLDLHLVEWQEKKENYAYRFNGIDQSIKHKFERLANWINQIANFLNKQGFVIRDDKF